MAGHGTPRDTIIILLDISYSYSYNYIFSINIENAYTRFCKLTGCPFPGFLTLTLDVNSFTPNLSFFITLLPFSYLAALMGMFDKYIIHLAVQHCRISAPQTRNIAVDSTRCPLIFILNRQVPCMRGHTEIFFRNTQVLDITM